MKTLAGWPARQPVGVLLVLVLLALAGTALAPRLPVERVQTTPGNTLTVRARAPGLDPAQIERQVTQPLEQVFAGLPALQDMVARSGDGVATLELRFPSARTRERALVDVAALVGLVAPQLPPGLDVPTIERIDPPSRPAAIYAVTAESLSGEVSAWAEQQLRRPLHELRQTARATLDGVATREVLIQPEPRRLVVLGLSFDDVIQALRAGDQTPARSNARRLAAALPTSVEALAARAVPLASGEPIALAEVANVSLTQRPAAQHPQYEGNPALLLQVYPGAARPATAVAERAKAHIGWLKANGIVPRDVSLHKLFDESEASRKWLRRVLRHFGVAIVVTAIATYLFLGLRTALAVFGAVAVWLPVSASVLWAAGLTLNVMTVVVILFAGVALVWFTLRLAVAPMFALLALTALIGVLFWRDALGVYAHAFLGFGMLTFVAGPVAWLVSAFTGVTMQAGTFMSGGLASRWPGHRGVLASLLGALILIAATWHVFSLSATLGTPVDGGTVALRVYGPQEGQLPVLADGVRARLRTLPEIADVSDPLERRQRWHLQLDEEKLRAADIGIIEVGRHFEIARSGLVVGRLTDAEAQMPLRVQLAPGAAGPAFEHLLLRGERPERPALYLRDVGMAEEADLPRERLRVQRRPALEIRAHWRGAAIPDAVVRLPDTVELPAGYELQLDVAPSSPTEAAIP